MISCSSASAIRSPVRYLTFRRSVCRKRGLPHLVQARHIFLPASLVPAKVLTPHWVARWTTTDLRNAVPKYRVWRDGVMENECQSVEHVWAETGDMVCFLLGM